MADQRREQMLQATLKVIVERGYADTRIADVAERAGASPALVIYYFKTKDQLLTEAIRYSEDSWYEAGTQVTPARAFELSMKYASGRPGFPWSPAARPQLSRR
jgi:AcrR family transcriptional regulator